MPAIPCTGDPLADALCKAVTDTGSAAFSAGATSALDALSGWVSTGASWFLAQVGGALGSTTRIDLSAPWFLDRYQAAEGLLAAIALPLLLAAILGAVLRQDLSQLLRIAVVQLPLGMLLAGAAVELTTLGLSITDQLSSSIAGGARGSLRSLTEEVSAALVASSSSSGSGATTPAFVLLLAAIVVAMAGLVLWIELVVRSASIYVAVVFLPLVLITMVWPALIAWSRRLAETLVVLVLSKLVIVVVLAMAVGALGTKSGRGFSTVVTGIALLLLAAFAPFSLLKLLPLAESSAAGHLEGLRQRSQRSVMSAAPRRAVDLAMSVASGGSGTPGLTPRAPGPRLGGAGVTSQDDPMATAARPDSEGGRSDPPVGAAPGGGGNPRGTSPGGSVPPERTGLAGTDPIGPGGRPPASGRQAPGPSSGPTALVPAPTRSVVTVPAPPAPESMSPWPRDPEPDDRPPLRPPSLVVEHDGTGPVIRRARPDRGGNG